MSLGKSSRRYCVLTPSVLLCALMLNFGCQSEQSAPAEQPPPTVTVAVPVQRSVIEWDEYTGRLEAVEFVEVRARVGGLIVSTPFHEGGLVAAGDLLVEIDARPFQAVLDEAIAAEAEAAAQLKFANIEFDRIQKIPESARSSTELDRASATLEQAKAVCAGTAAAVAAARLNFEWCRVVAPISGRVGRKLVTQGNLISGGTGQSTLLTTITSIDPIYCYVDADERSILKYAELARAGRRVSAREAEIQCFLQLSDEKGFPHEGVVDFVDNRVDPLTGTIRGRGVFRNSDGWMLPGFFARIRIPGTGRYDTLLVPDAAVMTDQNQKILFVVDENSVVHPRTVKLGALFGDLRSIASGVDSDDRVVINGLVHARSGVKVKAIDGSFSLDSLSSDVSQTPAADSDPTTQPADADSGAPA